MRDGFSQIWPAVHRAGQVAAEALWPTRCIVCDAPGHVLCPSCWWGLDFIDQWDACPKCGAPHGRVQCTECNTYSLREMGYRTPPFDQCVSAVRFSQESARIVRGRKDQNERRLAQPMGFLVACSVPNGWLHRVSCVCSVPSSTQTIRRRGFDHGQELAGAVADCLDIPCVQLLEALPVHDQRGLDRAQRMENMLEAFRVGSVSVPPGVLLVDDVYTTGATLMAATVQLKGAGAEFVACATFARVY